MSHGVHAVQHEVEHQIEHDEHGGGHGHGDSQRLNKRVALLIAVIALFLAFAETLGKRTGLPVQLWDERLTTVEAGRVLRSSGISIEKRAAAVDRLAAVLLLQSYLDFSGGSRGANP